MIRKVFKVAKAVCRSCRFVCSTWHVLLLFRLDEIRFGKGLCAVGFPAINVSFGEKVVVAAGSVVISAISAGETWGGNPARSLSQ